ncbi:MAG TPA: MarR family transcriptional regulator [Steroidobacteraceae bacterium]|nr:MarR family transcriptional regulator [Steroidobacteraceae bacterium]
MASTRDRLEQRALLAARSLVDRMRALYRELERLTGAPIAVHRALACIGDEPGITASSLALSLGMQRPAVSHVLRSLVERGWVERVRSASDQRSVRVYLTAAGRTLRDATAGRAVGALQRSVRRLSQDKLKSLAVGLEEVLKHLPAPPAEAVRMRVGTFRTKSRAMPAGTAVASGRGSGKVHR